MPMVIHPTAQWFETLLKAYAKKETCRVIGSWSNLLLALPLVKSWHVQFIPVRNLKVWTHKKSWNIYMMNPSQHVRREHTDSEELAHYHGMTRDKLSQLAYSLGMKSPKLKPLLPYSLANHLFSSHELVSCYQLNKNRWRKQHSISAINNENL